MPTIRNFKKTDATQVDAVAIAAFEQYEEAYLDWSEFKENIGRMSALSNVGEVIVAEEDGQIVGAVAYIGAGKPKASYFQPEWPIMRMLVVAPYARGRGIGRILAKECISRAQRDGASLFALHTSGLMDVALPMYKRMGFKWVRNTPPIHGVEYGVYIKDLSG
ncbi:GNAT family N-acetyltransferase [Oceanicoccus sagamiensis]|uniref:GNAT family N-acetyltransferase n=1 Tax=Oceanicoccus sagamiensis TaxID=716816 RepID=A0A1X9N749_9GAMM|nr:GNAT family N-acetyltransferase [Oceanicoccus sagamiensis]ARN73918.1 GNAT family N-acetyltransferase [Oceanicoccus sagamiensis]